MMRRCTRFVMLLYCLSRGHCLYDNSIRTLSHNLSLYIQPLHARNDDENNGNNIITNKN